MSRSTFVLPAIAAALDGEGPLSPERLADAEARAEAVLVNLAEAFRSRGARSDPPTARDADAGAPGTAADVRYRALVEQMPAVVFLADLDDGVGEAYVSPEIESALGFTQQEWLEDPIRWYHRIHPDDKERWSIEAADMLLSGRPLRSAYRVVARDGRVIWFHCQAALIQRADGRPWFIHGVGVDITDLKRAEQALQEERNLVAAILDSVGALVAVLDPGGHILRFNRACERASGRAFADVRGQRLCALFETPAESGRFAAIVAEWCGGTGPSDQEGSWVTAGGDRRIISWSGTVLRGADGLVEYIIASGNDVTERKRLEAALLEISGHEQRRIGQDLHDGLGQHLTGTAFMSKVLQQRLEEHGLPEAAEAGRIVQLVNEAIEKTRELSRGLVPVVSGADGLMASLQRLASEVEDLFCVACRFECETPVLLDDVASATHLFHIAQEAVSNAIKHGGASRIVIVLSDSRATGRLTIEDDGVGIGRARPAGTPGMGLHIMRYRARMFGGSCDVRDRPGSSSGTLVDCRFPREAHQ